MPHPRPRISARKARNPPAKTAAARGRRGCKICGAALRWPRSSYCSIECFREADAARNRRRYAANPEKERERARRYRAADPERHRDQVRRYHATKLAAQAAQGRPAPSPPRTGIGGKSNQSMHQV